MCSKPSSSPSRPVESKLKKKQIVTDQSKRLHKSSRVQKAAKKLAGARFRYINEKLYNCTGQEAFDLFLEDSDLFSTYHNGFREQVSQWPLNPLDCLIKYVSKLPQNYIIADFGCGEGRLSLSVPHEVHSFDFVAVGDHVTPCDMSNVPLDTSSVDMGVFCLSLMGLNLIEYLFEARRVIKRGGILKIYEIQSRVSSVEEFVSKLESIGFRLKKKKMLNKMFIDLEFVLVDKNKKTPLKQISLKPCLYKKR